ncbi:Gti1/Pac2 family-domain-containing protein [Cokeromyces recurvatus]|uniref:Gti1/Pac2 family-domain-containing protein n=1 Tax=Cokeromyces recurvatus TaxID=90255 RepID=UPI00221FB6B7|nr:Gti1/Pac2 family-domain-containing protein [Cokeromyces recurvatus]KAI7906509.1 Gti1/Pac2 family-domain-containing protein [Cokeromyces recurvatus]
MLVTETFHGYIETTQDVLLIFEGCRRGLLPKITKRLQERDRKMIRSGSVFVFDEKESGIKRWTDGRVWSPSRILGNFLIYRELDNKKGAGENKKRLSAYNHSSNTDMSFGNPLNNTTIRRSFSIDGSINRDRERQLIGSLSDSYRFKENGLIKKTMSIVLNGVAQHLISYYDPNDVLQEKLRAPSSVPELASLEISPELLAKENFRIPPFVEPTFDSSGQTITTEGSSSTASSYTHRMLRPPHRMSIGSIRGQDQSSSLLAYHPYLPPQQQQQQQQQHRASFSIASSSSNQFQQNSIMYGNNNNNNGYDFNQSRHLSLTNGLHPTVQTSPLNLVPSPNTPMTSPSRYSQHQRHYSTSSINNLPPFDSLNYEHNNTNTTTDTNTTTNPTSPHRSMDPILPIDNSPFSANSRQQQQRQQQQQQSERFATPNLGQLLNPVHPLSNNNNTNSSSPSTTHNVTEHSKSNSNNSRNNQNSNDLLQTMGLPYAMRATSSIEGQPYGYSSLPSSSVATSASVTSSQQMKHPLDELSTNNSSSMSNYLNFYQQRPSSASTTSQPFQHNESQFISELQNHLFTNLE